MPDRNLVLLDNPYLRSPSDFIAIKRLIQGYAPDIETFIIPNGHLSPVTQRAAARRPSLIFCPEAIAGFRPRRGRVYAGRRIPKSTQVAALRRAGLPTPRSVRVGRDTRLDPAEWGSFTVLKPDNALQGQGVRLVRTRDVRWVDPGSWPRNDPRYGREMIAQEFVDTGPNATSYRVMTVFGRPVYSLASIALHARPPLDPNGRNPIELPVASNAGPRRLVLNFAADIINLGAAVYRALPVAPVHGVDVVRDVRTGELFVLEFNPGGFTWHLSSPYFAKYRREFGLDLHAQFGAIPIIARALIERTRTEAI